MSGRSARSKKGEKSARTRQRILDAAASVLARKGYAGTRMNDIAEVADYPAPAMYYYFGSRDELVDEVMRLGGLRTREYVEAVLAALPEDTGSMERICAAVEAHVRIVLSIADYSTAATRNMGQLPDPLRSSQLREQERYGDVWRKLLQRARAEGAIPESLDLGIARMYVLGALNWVPEWWQPGRGSVDAVVDTALKLTCAGLFNGHLPPRRAQLAGVPFEFPPDGD